jgi:cell division septal protein FtsQ
MDHHEQHHQHHEKQREEKKKEQKEFERAEEKSALPFHPAWLVVVGAVLVLGAVLIYTILLNSGR